MSYVSFSFCITITFQYKWDFETSVIQLGKQGISDYELKFLNGTSEIVKLDMSALYLSI